MLRLNIETDNAAFEVPAPELARLLHEAGERIQDGETSGSLYDVNGNQVGAFELED
jgi:hypothetical protein